MVGITLSPEQIRSAPPEVRRWIEQEITKAIGGESAPAAPEHPPPHLVALSLDETRGILQQIQNMLPAVAVFFELGRETGSVPRPGLRVLRLGDIMSHALLHIPAQVIQCLESINQAARTVRNDADALLCVVDRNGNCLLADETARSIVGLWQEIVAARALEPPPEPVGPAEQVASQKPVAYAAGWPAVTTPHAVT